jgi:signal peptidase II
MAAKSGWSIKNVLPWFGLSVVIFLIDQVTKITVERVFDYGQRLPVWPFFDLTLWYNKGAAFSFLAGASGWQREFFIIVGTGASLFILYLLGKHGTQKLFSLALALILGGAVGNVVDRVLHGHVIDFLLFHYKTFYWPAFNVADMAIVGGAGLLILDELIRVRKSKT